MGVDESSDAAALATAVAAVPGVAALSAGAFGDVVSYLPGDRVIGIRQRQSQLTVAVVADYGACLPMLGAAIRATIKSRLPAVRCDVEIVNLTDPMFTFDH